VKAPLSLVAVTCAASLLTAVPHFNFRTDLLKIVIAQLSRRTADEAFVKCRDAMETLFREDEEGRAGLEAVTMISQMVKKRYYKVHPSVSSHFMTLTIDHSKSIAFTITDGIGCQSFHRHSRKSTFKEETTRLPNKEGTERVQGKKVD
jgi:hypothetical protein